MNAYIQEWRFNNGQTMEREKFYVSDNAAMAGTLQSFKWSNPEWGEVVRVLRGCDEVGCLRAGDVRAGRVRGTTLRLS